MADHQISPSATSMTSARTLSNSTQITSHDFEATKEQIPRQSSNDANLSLRRTASRRDDILARVRSRQPYPTFSHPLSHKKTTAQDIVDFDGKDDPYHPLNWAFRKKVFTTALYGFTTMGATFASSVYSPGIEQISVEFGVGREVSTLGLALLLAGFGLGPLLWAPLSEIYGRKPAVLTPYFLAAIFSFATAVARDIQTIMITRFFAGFFGSAPITNTGGVLGDIFAADQRGVAIVGYAMAVVGGPTLGPIVGGAIVQHTTWRWTEYTTGILMLFMLTLDVIFLDESYPAVLLVRKASKLRHETGNWALHAQHEEWTAGVSIKDMAHKFLVRPIQVLFTPIGFCVALYASFVYGIVYMLLGAIPIIFQEERGWNYVVGSLPFLAVLIGICFGAAINILNQKYYVRRYHAAGDHAVPEARLPPMMIGSVFFAAGIFIVGWTGDKRIHWIAPCMGLACMGLGFFVIFQAALNYLIDTFSVYAASAVAANTFLRSCFASAFPLVVTPMYHNLGIGWASSLWGFIAVALVPIPFLFYVFGRRIRVRGKYSRGSVYEEK
jgi:multidrug resistance protein